MKETIKHIADYFGADSNTIVTILSTIFVFGLGIVISIIGKEISKIFKRCRYRTNFKFIVSNISEAVLKQSKEFHTLSESLTIIKEVDFSIKQRANPHLNTWDKLDFGEYYDAFFGRKIICQIKFKRKAFNKVFECITNVQNTEKIYAEQFVNIVEKYNLYQSSWNAGSEKIRQIYSILISTPADSKNLNDFIERFSDIMNKWQKLYPTRNLQAINDEILPELNKMCDEFKQFNYTLVIRDAVSDVTNAYNNLNELLRSSNELFRIYYYNYRLITQILKKAIKIL